MKKKLLIIGFFLLLAISFANAHEEDIDGPGIDEQYKVTSLDFLLITSLLVVILVVISLYQREKSEEAKWILFLGIAIPILLSTAYLAYTTVHLNVISETQGPVHWHADYEIWNCGNKVELIKPKGLSNRIGSPLFHDHGDNRIHVEGVVLDKTEVDLHSFFETVGGTLENNKMEIPTDGGTLEIMDGEACNGNEGKLQMFVYKIINPEDAKSWLFEQSKIENFEEYVLSPYSQIPPGDCIIIEFGVKKQQTERICETYKAAIERGELSGG